MKASNRLLVVGAVLIVGIGVVAGLYLGQNPEKQATMIVPQLSDQALEGQVAFRSYCSQCHGVHAEGTDKGPPLVHRIYEPSHHSDFAFVRAVTLGVPRHHWRFDSMPAQPEVKREEISAIVTYVRELQRANGIT